MIFVTIVGKMQWKISKSCMIWICTFLLCSLHFVDCKRFPSLTRLSLLRPANAVGSESLAFDPLGGGPYAGAVDGRILKYLGPRVGFVDFAYTSPWRMKECDGTNGASAVTCGRPTGLGFDYVTGDLYFLDINFGFQVVPPSGGAGISIATKYNDSYLFVPNALDIDQACRDVYFTDAGLSFLTGLTELIRNRDTSGVLYRYNIRARQLSLVINGLSGPTGLAVSRNGDYLVISEYLKSRIVRFWLKGRRAFRLETLLNLPGRPDNIKRTAYGHFWVAVTIGGPPRLGRRGSSAIGIRFNRWGRILESRNFTGYYRGAIINEVQEHLGKLYVTSMASPFVGEYEK